MLDTIIDILGGTIGNLVLGIFQVIVSVVCSFLVSCLGAVAELFLAAMTITPTDIETWLGAPLTTGSFAGLITYSGIAIAMLFALWELCRGLMSSIQGENPPMRPYVVGMRFLIFGAWSFGGISFSKVIFNVGSKIYQSVPFDSVTNGFLSDTITFLDTAGTSLATWIGSTATAIFGQVTWASSLIGRILATLLIVFALIGFLKLLFTCSQRYVNMIFYTYFSPLAIACGVSSSWSKVTWTWMKTLLSTLVLWVLDVWCVFGGLNLLHASVDAMANQMDLIGALSCLLVTYGFMKGAIALDGIMSQFGATVTKTTGSLMGDMRDMMVMSHIAGSAARGMSNLASGVSTGVTRGAGIGNASKMSNLGLDKRNQGEARNALSTLKDGMLGGLGNTRLGGAALAAANAVAGMPKAVGGIAQEGRLAKVGQDKTQMAKDLGALNEKYKGKPTVDGKPDRNGTLPGNLPARNTAAGEAYNKELQALLDSYGEKGIGLEDLTNDPNVMKNMSENTLFDPKHPELGSMKDQGFECVGYRAGKNGMGKATFDKYDEKGHLQERRSLSQLGFAAVATQGATEKALENGMVAGTPGKRMFGGNVSGLKIMDKNGGNACDIVGVDAKHREMNKSLSAVRAPNLDGSQAVMVTDRDKAGMPVSQSTYMLKPGKTVHDGAEALASGKLDSAFVTQKDPKTGEMRAVMDGVNTLDKASRVTNSVYHPLSNESGPIAFPGKMFDGAMDSLPGSQYHVNAGLPSEDGIVPLAAVNVNDPSTVVARGSISQNNLEAAYSGGNDAMNDAMRKAFSGDSAEVAQTTAHAPEMHMPQFAVPERPVGAEGAGTVPEMRMEMPAMEGTPGAFAAGQVAEPVSATAGNQPNGMVMEKTVVEQSTKSTVEATVHEQSGDNESPSRNAHRTDSEKRSIDFGLFEGKAGNEDNADAGRKTETSEEVTRKDRKSGREQRKKDKDFSPWQKKRRNN